MEKVISLIQHFSQASEFEVILQPYIMSLYRVAYRLTGTGTDAEDLVQDVLVKLYPKRFEMAQIKKIRPWLIRVLYNTFIDQRRRAGRSPLCLVKKKYNEENQDILECIPSDKSGPEENTVKKQRLGHLMIAINSLNENQRHLCLLHDVEGYTLTELEEILDTPVGTLKSRLHRARANLRKVLRKETFSGS